MSPIQTGQQIEVNYKAETTFNVLPGATGAKRFRLNPSGGLEHTRATIRPNEIRRDLKSSMGRLGSRGVTGGYVADFSIGTFDELLEALLRGTWTAATPITFATMTSLTTGANTIIAAGGDWRTQGIRVGQVIRGTGFPDAGNNDKNLRVTGVTASTITVAETLIVNGAGDATGTITIQKRLIQPAAPVRRSFTWEQYYADIDESEVYTGARISSMRIAGGPDTMATLDFGIVAADMQVKSAGAAPYFTDPTLSSTIGLTLADAVLRYAGADVVDLTGFDLTIDNRQGGLAVVGSNVTPDVFDNAAQVAGTLTGARRDLLNVSRYLAETELELHALLVEPDVEPKDFFSLFIPRIKLTGVSRPLGDEGAMIETRPFMVGAKDAVTGYDDTMIQFATSAA